MSRTTKPANGTPTVPKPRAAKKGNGSANLKSPDSVARRAYEIYQGRGGSHGADLDDWLEAERQLTSPAPAKPKRRKPSEETGL
jgi:hypothetical protein